MSDCWLWMLAVGFLVVVIIHSLWEDMVYYRERAQYYENLYNKLRRRA